MTFIGFIAILLAVGGTVYFVKKKEKEESREGLNKAAANKAAQLRASQETDLSIGNVERGGMLSFSNIGPQMISMDVQVTDRHLYKSGAYSWHELEGDGDNTTVYVTLEGDEISLTLNEIPLNELPIEQANFSAQPNQELSYQGQAYHLDESGAATYCKSGNELAPEHYQYWDYESEDGSSYLSVVQWQDGSLEASYSVPVHANEVAVLSIRS